MALVSALAASLVACGDDEPPEPAGETVDILDPASDHYGKSYEEWAGDWVQWLYNTAPPECADPALDTTGEYCALYQDSTSPVFFLAGNYGGVSIREECVMSADKAIFFPLIMNMADNSGVPAEMIVSDETLRDYAEDGFALLDPDSLHVSVDGQAIDRLERGAIPTGQYSIDLAPGANIFDCNMVEGVEGEFNGFLSGYWAMFEPLEAGTHTISFGGTLDASSLGQSMTVDVTYELTVE